MEHDSRDAKRKLLSTEPWCWVEKPKLRMISEVFAEGKLGALGAARSVYLAMSEIASDKQSDTFIVATSYIAQRAGVAPKTVHRVIGILKRLGFVRTHKRSENGLKLATEYTLIRTNDPTMGKAAKSYLPIREECSEESRESTERKGSDKDIVIHSRTGERFNKRTGTFVW